MDGPDAVALERAQGLTNPDTQPKSEDNRAISSTAGADEQGDAGNLTNKEDTKKEGTSTEVADEDQMPTRQSDGTPASLVERPHPSVISEFDPFSSPSQAAGNKTKLSALWSSQLGMPSHASSSAATDEARDTETPAVEKSNTSVTRAPRKQQGLSLSVSESYSDSPSAARQKQTRGDASETAEQQHRHASAIITEGESRTNPKPKEMAFDFQGFLAQLRTRQAEPIQKYLKSFLVSFAKRSFTVTEQTKLIHDFLGFIALKMKQVEPWRSQNAEEFDNAMEAMEKLVMNRLYSYTFSPMVDTSIHPMTTDDLERDAVLHQRISLFGWVREKHLDVPEGEASQGFLAFAEQELLKINHYKAPRDKMICILNCCKVIFGLIRHEAGSEKTSADAFLPILIFVVLRANPDNMISNIEYINRFRSADKLQGEAGYYLSSLTGAISFIETMDATGLSDITPEEFDRNVEAAIAKLPPGSSADLPRGKSAISSPVSAPFSNTAVGEEPARALTSLPANFAANTQRFFQRTGELAQDAVNRPLSALANMIDTIAIGTGNDDGNSEDEAPGAAARRLRFQTGENVQTPPRGHGTVNIVSPSPARPDHPSTTSQWFGRPTLPSERPNDGRMQVDEMYIRSQIDLSRPPSGLQTPSNDPTFNFSEITAEIDRTHATARQAGIETLHQMFPNLDEEIAGDILDSCGGELGLAIDRMLEMASG